MYKRVLLSALLICICFQVHAQYDNHLTLAKGHKIKHHFLTGDSIRFLRNHIDFPIIGKLEAIGEDFFVIRGEVFPLAEINTVFYYRKSFNFTSGGKMLQFAGPGFLGIAAFNAIYNSIRPIWTVSNLITGGSIYLSGLILPLLQVRKYKLGKKYYLRIIPTDPAVPGIRY